MINPRYPDFLPFIRLKKEIVVKGLPDTKPRETFLYTDQESYLKYYGINKGKQE